MASLALMVSVIFLGIIISGPLLYLIAKLKILPYFIIDIVGICIIAIGLWWFFVLPSLVGCLGLLTGFLAWRAMMLSRKHT